MKIPFARVPLAGNELKYIEEVLLSGWLTTSDKARQFEELFARRVGVKYACAVNSCTAALHLAMDAIGVGPGDKVLVPSLTFTASAEVVRYMGADPVFLDVDEYSMTLTPAILEEALIKFKGIKALILVHFGGQAAIMGSDGDKGIVGLCKEHGVSLVEDAAHAFPSMYNDQHVGSFGDVGCFSFYANKTITTAEGGMLVCDDEQIYERARTMRLHGINKDIWKRYTNDKPSWQYDVVAPGFKYNMPDVNAAIGLAQLEKANVFRDRRQACAAYYYDALKALPHVRLPKMTGSMENHSWHLFPIVLAETAKMDRNAFIEAMSAKGIGTSVHYRPLHRMQYYQETYMLDPADFPQTERIWKGTVSLPIYPGLTDSELEYICKSIHELLNDTR